MLAKPLANIFSNSVKSQLKSSLSQLKPWVCESLKIEKQVEKNPTAEVDFREHDLKELIKSQYK